MPHISGNDLAGHRSTTACDHDLCMQAVGDSNQDQHALRHAIPTAQSLGHSLVAGDDDAVGGHGRLSPGCKDHNVSVFLHDSLERGFGSAVRFVCIVSSQCLCTEMVFFYDRLCPRPTR